LQQIFSEVRRSRDADQISKQWWGSLFVECPEGGLVHAKSTIRLWFDGLGWSLNRFMDKVQS
jgi:hypothetical protein